MKTVGYSDLRANLAGIWDEVAGGQPVQLTRQGAADLVLLSEADYRGLVETASLMASPANATRLAAAVTVLAEQGGDIGKRKALAAHMIAAGSTQLEAAAATGLDTKTIAAYRDQLGMPKLPRGRGRK